MIPDLFLTRVVGVSVSQNWQSPQQWAIQNAFSTLSDQTLSTQSLLALTKTTIMGIYVEKVYLKFPGFLSTEYWNLTRFHKHGQQQSESSLAMDTSRCGREAQSRWAPPRLGGGREQQGVLGGGGGEVRLFLATFKEYTGSQGITCWIQFGV